MMRKYAILILFALLLNGCDDGDITVETIDFKDVDAVSCTTTNQLIYKLKSQESLLMQLPEGTLKNNPTTPGNPLIYNIDNSLYRLVYRSYNGAVAQTNICSLIPPATPSIINEWYALSGVISITTTSKIETNTTTGATKITGYTHNIVINNLTYSIADLNVTQPQIVFGDFDTTIPTSDQLVLTFTKDVQRCTTSGQLYTYNDNSAMTIDNLEAGLIQNTVTPAGQPRTGFISATANKLNYKVYTGSPVGESIFCGNTPPASPVLKETWDGVPGVDANGVIEVTTTTNGPNTLKHTIVLRSTSIKKDNNTINLGTSYVLGNYYTTIN